MDGKQLRAIRKRLGLSQAALAGRLLVTENTVARWERNEIAITPPMGLLISLIAREPDVDAATHTGGSRQVAASKPAKSSRAADPKGKGGKPKSTVQRKRR